MYFHRIEALDTRRALRGYAGVVPSTVAVGDTIQVLNLGRYGLVVTSSAGAVRPLMGKFSTAR